MAVADLLAFFIGALEEARDESQEARNELQEARNKSRTLRENIDEISKASIAQRADWEKRTQEAVSARDGVIANLNERLGVVSTALVKARSKPVSVLRDFLLYHFAKSLLGLRSGLPARTVSKLEKILRKRDPRRS